MKIIKKLLLVCIAVLVFAGPLFSQEEGQGGWSLEEMIRYARENNLQVKLSRLDHGVRSENLRQSRLDRYPSLNFDASQNMNFGRSVDPTTYLFSSDRISTSSFGLSTQVVLFDGFRKNNTIRQNQYLYSASEHALEETMNDITLNLLHAYLQVLLSEEQVKIMENQVEISLQQLENTEKLIKAGAFPEGQSLEIRAQLTNDRYHLTQAINQVDLAYLNIQLLLDLVPSEDFSIVMPELVVETGSLEMQYDPQEIYNKALQINPVVRRSEDQLQGAQAGVDIARGSHYPTISLYGSFSSSYSDARYRYNLVPLGFDTIGYVNGTGAEVISRIPTFETETQPFPFVDQLNENFHRSVGVRMTVPIFNNHRANQAVNHARANHQSRMILHEQEKSALRNEIYTAYANAVASARKFEAAMANVEAMEQAFEFIERRAAQGLVKPVEVLLAKNNLEHAQSNMIQAKYEFIFRSRILDFYSGEELTF